MAAATMYEVNTQVIWSWVADREPWIRGSATLAIVVSSACMIEANFKEDQLTHMRVGQPVDVHVDSYPGKKFEGTVASVSPGTGSQFSLLPPENATGNWVKVVQRLPVRIELRQLDPEFPLHGGLSATVDVDTGHERHVFGSGESRAVAARPADVQSANELAAAK